MNPNHFEQPSEQVETPYPKQRKQRANRTSNLLFWKLFVAFWMVTIAFGGFFYLYLRYAPLPESSLAYSSKLMSGDGTVFADLATDGGQNRIKVSLQDIPKSLIDATLAVEDKDFYHHGGFDFRGIARALLVDIESHSVVEGGSTITQQLAKNLFLTDSQTLSRKLREALLTEQLEMNYSKDEILEQYLNVIYYGQGAYGIESAAQTYFHKPAKELDLAQSAMLAGIPRGPSLYNPYLDLNAAKARQKTVLDMMVKANYLTQAQADAAYKEDVGLAPKKTTSSSAPYFRDFVTQELKNSYGVTEEQLNQGGLQVHTTLDMQMQKAAEQAIADQMKNLPNDSKLQVALVAMDPNTGAIKAMVGGRDYDTSAYNRTIAKRQPGSSFKPFVYLTALNNNFTPATRIKSEPTTFTYKDDGGYTKTYSPHNFANEYANGYLTLRQCLARSDNVCAVTVNMDVGPDKVVQTAKAMGIQSDLKPYPSLALGTFPVTPLEMVGAYAPLANGGYKVTPHAVTEIDDTYNQKTQLIDLQKTSILDPGATFVLTDLLKSVYTDPHGTGYRVHTMFSRPVAGKTGTTDTDAWMIGYTPQLVTAVWIGYDKNTLLSPSESYLAAPIWAEFMNQALAPDPVQDFPVPSDVQEAYIDPSSGLLATASSPTQEHDYFLKGTAPTQWSNAQADNQPLAKTGNESGLSSFWKWLTGQQKKE